MPRSSEIYLAAVDKVTARALTWSATDAATPIPTCPGWSARDLVAHLAGGAADHAADRLDGFPRPAWTSRHILERSSATIRELVAELDGLAPQIAALCDQRPGAPNNSWDAYIHERDLFTAFGTSFPPLDEYGHELLRQIIGYLAANAPFQIAVAPAGSNCVQIAVTDKEQHRAVVEASAAFRAITARATPGASAQWSWLPTAPPSRVINELSLF